MWIPDIQENAEIRLTKNIQRPDARVGSIHRKLVRTVRALVDHHRMPDLRTADMRIQLAGSGNGWIFRSWNIIRGAKLVTLDVGNPISIIPGLPSTWKNR